MKSKTSKVLFDLAGLPVVAYPIQESLSLKPKRIVLVVARGCEESFRERLGDYKGVDYCVQKNPLGTGDAVRSAERFLKGLDGHILILPGDVPLISAENLRGFVSDGISSGASCSVVSTKVSNPFAYGRIIRDGDGKFTAIREEKDASDAEKRINEINTGIFLAEGRWLFQKLRELRPQNAQKEYYLTDIVQMAVAESRQPFAHCITPAEQFLGINDRIDLFRAGKFMQVAVCLYWMKEGVSIPDPEQTYIDSTVRIGGDSSVAPFAFLKGRTTIGAGCVIGAGAVIEDSVIGDNVHIRPYSVIEKSVIGENAVVGPFSRLRPETMLRKDVRVGNFVEVKKSVLNRGVKANHLSYIGDAVIGAGTNVGCGTITCNYDGVKKHRTLIGEGVFVGSDVQFVAPVRIGRGAVIGAGSTITKNVPPSALALSRTPQVNVKAWAKGRR